MGLVLKIILAIFVLSIVISVYDQLTYEKIRYKNIKKYGCQSQTKNSNPYYGYSLGRRIVRKSFKSF